MSILNKHVAISKNLLMDARIYKGFTVMLFCGKCGILFWSISISGIIYVNTYIKQPSPKKEAILFCPGLGIKFLSFIYL